MPAAAPVRVPTVADSPTLDVPTAGALLGLGRASSYRAAKRGDIPTIRFGSRVVVPTAALRRMLGLDPEATA